MQLTRDRVEGARDQGLRGCPTDSSDRWFATTSLTLEAASHVRGHMQFQRQGYRCEVWDESLAIYLLPAIRLLLDLLCRVCQESSCSRQCRGV